MLVHVVVHINGIQTVVSKSVVSEDLAVWNIWVSFDTFLRSLEILVENIKLIKISWSEFCTVNSQVSKKSALFVHFNNK